MATAMDVAAMIVNYFGKSDEDNDLTQLKLQKLLYYCQGYSLAILDRPLFAEKFEAWQHGPVCPNVYEELKSKFGDGIYKINELNSGDESNLTPEEKEVCAEVLEVLGQFSAWRLREMTHAESLWSDNYRQNTRNEIPVENMKAFFEQRVN